MRQLCGKLIEAASTCLHNAGLACAVLRTPLFSPAQAASQLVSFLDGAAPGDLAPGADSFGPQHAQIPVVPALRGGKIVGWVFLTSHDLDIGRTLLGDAAYANFKARLEEGDEAIFVGGSGRCPLADTH